MNFNTCTSSSSHHLIPSTVSTYIPQEIGPRELEEKISFYWGTQQSLNSDHIDTISMYISSYLAQPYRDEVCIRYIYEICSTLIAQHPTSSLEKASFALLEREQLAARYILSPHTFSPKKELFVIAENRSLFEKWCSIQPALDPIAFFLNPVSSSFILQAKIIHSTKHWNIPITCDEKTHILSTIIESKLQPLELYAQKLTEHTDRLACVATDFRIVEKENRQQTWCVLPSRGLCRWSETQWQELKPCGKVDSSIVENAKKLALLSTPSYDEESNPDKETYIIEIVSSWKKNPCNFITDGFETIFTSSKHPWIRIIRPDGLFYSIGFNIAEKISFLGQVSKGILRSPDPYETASRLSCQITGIKATKAQYEQLIHYINDTQQRSVDFQFVEQNCTKFIQEVVNLLGLKKKNGKNIRFFARGLPEICLKIQPLYIQKMLKLAKPMYSSLKKKISSCIPKAILNIVKAFQNLFFSIAERGLLTVTGRTISYWHDRKIKSQDAVKKKIYPWQICKYMNTCIKKARVFAFLPACIIKWQLRLISTNDKGKKVLVSRVIRLAEEKRGYHSQYMLHPSSDPYYDLARYFVL